MNQAAGVRDGRLSSFFKFRRYGTNPQTEIIAGLSTYLALASSYILTPAILSKAGLDPSAVLFATVVVSCVATIAMGLWANLPFAVSVGIEMSGFFAFVVCGTLHMSWQDGLGTVFISGLLCLLFTALRIRKDIIDAIPSGLKKAIGTSVGVFVATIGFVLAHILIFSNGRIDTNALSTSLFTSQFAYVLYTGLVLAVLFGATPLKFPGGMLLAIGASACLCAYWGIHAATAPQLSTNMTNAVGRLHLGIVLDPRFWSPILVFFVIDFLGGIGKFIGLTANTNIRDAEGNLPNISRGLYVDGAGTLLASYLGTTGTIAYIESSVGIKAGGRTGLTAIVCGILMGATIFLTPVLKWIPSEAVAGVLVFVGYLLLPGVSGVEDGTKLTWFDVVVALAMGIVSFFTFSLDRALAIGFWAYFVASLLKPGEPFVRRFWLGAIAILLTGTITWQLLMT